MNWDSEIEKLKRYVFVDNLSYEEIGRIYNCSGNNIKNILKRRNIELPVRNKYTKGISKNKKYFCVNCGKEISRKKNNNRKYCNNTCQQQYEYKLWIENYKKDNSIVKTNKWGQIPGQLRRFIFDKYGNKCCLCGWSKINPFTNTIPLEIDHIDGNSENNSESNLRLLCPNCHSLTETYRGANKGNGRNITWIIKS